MFLRNWPNCTWF